jgi:type IV pilus assembly protein PilM
MSLFSSWLASPPPEAAIEIAADHVSAAVIGERGGSLVVQGYAAEPLPPGVVTPSLTATNIHNRSVVVSALRTVLDRAGARPRRVALVIPDLAAKVSLIRFDTIPARDDDLEQLVRWQVKKASPFPIEDAAVTYSPGARAADGSAEFVVVSARRDVIAEYEGLCDELKIEPGLVDLATLCVVNLFLGGNVPEGDWLIVHLRPESTSIVIMRGADVMFFRNRAEGDEASIADLVHQTAMYYQDRLSGQQFSRVFLGGSGRVFDAVESARRSLEERLGASVEPIDPTKSAALTDRISATPDLMDVLAPLVGMAVRTRREAVTA